MTDEETSIDDNHREIKLSEALFAALAKAGDGRLNWSARIRATEYMRKAEQEEREEDSRNRGGRIL